jgi:hypothetical protein
MTTATARTPAFHRAVFEDGLGPRHHADTPTGEPLELLELRDDLRSEAFEAALRDRVAALAGFHTTFFAQVRGVQRHQQNAARLFVLSDRVAGARLSSVLANRPQLGVNASLCLVRQLMAAIALLHEKLPGMAHGAISAERVVVTPKARLVVVDYALGSALEQLNYPAERYWRELRIPVPPGEAPKFDQQLDVMQIGIMVLELILGRPVEPSEYPDQIPDLAERACFIAARDDARPLPAEFRTWLLRMLQMDGEEPPFASAVDAWADLEQVLAGSNNAAAFAALEAIMADYGRQSTPAAPTMAAPQAVTRKVLAAVPSMPRPAPVPDVDSDEAEAPSAPPVSTGATVVPMPRPFVASSSSSPVPETEPTRQPELVLPFAQADDKPTEPGSDVMERETPTPARTRRWIAAAAVLLCVGGAAFFGRQLLVPSAVAEVPGTLVVSTNPPGFQVFIDGHPRGVTPLSIELAAGAHELKLATDGEPRIIPITITAGSTVSQTLEFATTAAPSTGQLSIRTEPPGALVKIDGTPNGTTPLTVDALTPGAHSVTLESDVTSVTQEVLIEAGTTASLVVPMTAPQGVPVSGWISVTAPAELEVYENGQLLGTSQTDRIMVSAGRHEFELVNTALGYRITRVVTVAPGKVSPLTLEWPKGIVAVNAQPWADVWIGGERIGETPIGNISLPLGTHDITFRHPQLGEQVVRATVTAGAPTRVSVDMRKR